MRWTGIRPVTWLVFYLLWMGTLWWLAVLELGVHDLGLRWLAGAVVLYGALATGYRWRRRTAIADALAGRADPGTELLPAVDGAAREIRSRSWETWLSPALIVAMAAILGVEAGPGLGPLVAAPITLAALSGCYAFVVQRRLLRAAERWLTARPPGPPWWERRSTWPRPQQP